MAPSRTVGARASTPGSTHLMHSLTHLVPLALLSLASCDSAPPVSESDSAEFRQAAETFQQIYIGGGGANGACDRGLAFISEDLEMTENGNAWTYEDMVQICPNVPEKQVIDSWSDRVVLSPDLAHDFVSMVYEIESGARRRETTSRLWEKTADGWKIVRMNNVMAPVAPGEARR